MPAGTVAARPRNASNAYMLVYVRLADWDRVMAATGAHEMEPRVRARSKHIIEFIQLARF